MSRAECYVVVGLGSIGRRHLGNLRKLRPHSRIAALRQRQSSGNELPDGCDEVIRSVEEACALQPTAVVISSPAPFHVATASAFIAAGVPVFIEKPVSDQFEDAAELTELAAQSGVPAMIGYNLRFEPSVQRLHELLQAGEAGEVLLVRGYVGQYLPDWRRHQDYRTTVSARRQLGGGALLELSHELDLLCWMFGHPSVVHCRGGRLSDLEIEVEDAVELTLEFDHPRRLASIGLNFLERAPKRTFSLVGTEATLTWDGIARAVTITRSGGSEPEIHAFADTDRNGAYLAELDHFLACCQKRTQPAIGLRDGLNVMAVIEAARESMRISADVHLPNEA